MLGNRRKPFTLDFDRVIILGEREPHVSGLDLLQLESTENGIWSTDFPREQVPTMFGNFDIEGVASGASMFKERAYTKWSDFSRQRDDPPAKINGRVDENLLIYVPEFILRAHLERFRDKPIVLNFTPTEAVENWLIKDYVEFWPR